MHLNSGSSSKRHLPVPKAHVDGGRDRAGGGESGGDRTGSEPARASDAVSSSSAKRTAPIREVSARSTPVERLSGGETTAERLASGDSPLGRLRGPEPWPGVPLLPSRAAAPIGPIARPTGLDVGSSPPPAPPSGDATAGGDPAVRAASFGKSDAEIERILADVETLRNGTQEERVQAVFSLAENLQPDEIGELTAELGIDDRAVVKLLSDTEALGAVATLVSEEASPADKVSATLRLAESTGGLATGTLGKALERPLATLSAGRELIALVEAFDDPEASALDRAEATLSFATAVKDGLGGLVPNLAHDLRRLDTLGNGVAAALTLIDPEASAADRAEAVVELFANVPDVRDDLAGLNRVLARHTDIALEVPDGLARQLDPRVLESLTPEQLLRIDALGEGLVDGGTDAAAARTLVHDLVSRIDDPASLDALLDVAGSAPDAAGRKALIETFEALEPGALDGLLKVGADGRSGARALADTVASLDDAGRASLRKLVGSFDAEAIDVLTRIGAQVDAGTLGDFLKVADALPSREVGKALTFVDEALRAAGVVLTPATAGKLLKGVGKLVPLAGAVPAIHDIGQLAGVVADTSLPPDIRYLAATGIKINATDVVSSVAEAFFGWTGAPIALDVSVGVAALTVDLIVTDQLAKHDAARASGEAYGAPRWLTTANVATAAALGPPGWTEYWALYGGADGVEALGVAAESGGSAAIDAAEGLLILGTEGVGAELERTADGLHLLADIVRHPERYGERAAELDRRAVDRLGELADGAGDLAAAARDELVGLAGDLKGLGEDGLDALGWIASNPGEAADVALEAIGEVAKEALALGTEAGRVVAGAALDTLDAAIDAGGRAAAKAREVVGDIVADAVALGEEGVETLGWIASHPGESARIAGRALVELAVEGGELAHAAYERIVELGEAGVDLARDVVGNLVELGEDGIDMLAFIASRPGEAAELAVDGLKRLAEGVGEAAERAVHELVALAESGVDRAGEALGVLLVEGHDAVRNVIVALGENVGPGLTAVINGLADLGDAGIDALAGLADAGFDFAMDGFAAAADAIGDAGSWVWNNTGGRAWDRVFGD